MCLNESFFAHLKTFTIPALGLFISKRCVSISKYYVEQIKKCISPKQVSTVHTPQPMTEGELCGLCKGQHSRGFSMWGLNAVITVHRADQALTTLAMRKFCEDKVSSSLQPSQNR